MAYDETYSFTTLAGNSSDFTWDGPDVDVLSAENTDGAWCWTDTGSTSSSTGPPSGTDCVYIETSSPVTNGDIFIMTLAAANEVDASAYSLYVEFELCLYGSDTTGTFFFDAWDGSDWNNIDDWTAQSSSQTFTSEGPYDLTAYDNDDFSIRFRAVVGTGTTYHNDKAITDIRIYGEDKVTDPEITNIEDEDLEVGETAVVITGTTFETDGANSRVRIDSSSAGTGTSQTQTDTSWSDTSIQFTVSLGSLDYGTNYVFVRNQSLNENATGYTVNLFQALSTTSMNDSSFQDGATGIIVNGSGFGSTQGDSEVLLCENSDGSGTQVVQTVTSWGASAITFTVDQGTLANGTAYVIVERDNSSLGDTAARLTNAQTITLEATPTITSVGGDNKIVETEEDAAIVGTDFGTVEGTVEICPAATYSAGTAEEQTVTSWGATGIDFDVVLGDLSLGVNYLFVTNDGGLRNATGYLITITPAPISTGLWKTASIQGTITSSGYTATAFLISDE